MILGHQKQWQFLKKSADSDRIPHSFLFFGQERLGKKRTAIEFIKLLNCQSSGGERPCQVCASCQNIEKLQHPDFIYIEPFKKEIQISQIRDLIQRLSFKPFQSRFKTAVLDNVHLITKDAQTALLKTLEEPKGNAILILITEHPEALFPTILSRVQKIRFQPLQNEEIEKFLADKGLEEKKAQFISSFSSGKPGLAIDFFSSASKLDVEKEKLADLAEIIISDSLASRFRYVKKIIDQDKSLAKEEQQADEKNAVKFGEILESWLKYFREALLLKIGAAPKSENRPEVQKISEKYSVLRLKEIIKALQNVGILLSTTNASQRLALEMIMLEL